MRMLDLFSGIGGFSLAAECVWGKDLEIAGFVEKDRYCRRLLRRHWHRIPIFDDIRNFHCFDRGIDLITGGFPCQDISHVGKRKGINGKRSSLWFEYRRIISEVRPKFAIIENVAHLKRSGLDIVLAGLAEIGYDAEWQSISAKEVGAWHGRERIWIVAYPQNISQYSNSDSLRLYTQEMYEYYTKYRKTKLQNQQKRKLNSFCDNVSNETCLETIQEIRENKFNYWRSEPPVGRVANGIPDRVDRIKALGNAIVPQNAIIIMEQIKKFL